MNTQKPNPDLPQRPNIPALARNVGWYWLLFLPIVFIFDTVYYVYTRSSCLQCWNLSEFVRESSLSFFLVSSVFTQLRGKS